MAHITSTPLFFFKGLFMTTFHPTPSTSRRWFGSLAALGALGMVASRAGAQTSAPEAHAHKGHNPGDMLKHAERRIDHMVKAVGGSPEQKDKLMALAKNAMADLKPLREQVQKARQAGMAMLSAANIDRTGIERLRGEQMGAMDAISKRMVVHMTDAAEVFTPEQRGKLSAMAKERMEKGGRWGRYGGGHGGDHGGGMGGGWFGRG
jgi:Spy/CpxP family protein refolding chaperone